MNMSGNISMKHLLIFLSVIGLTGCSLSTDVPVEGEEVSVNEGSQKSLSSENTLSPTPTEPIQSSLGDGIEVDPQSIRLSSQDAFDIISQAKHNCKKVVSTVVKSDSTIATCDNGESYRVLIVTKPKHMPLAISCSALKETGIEGGC